MKPHNAFSRPSAYLIIAFVLAASLTACATRDTGSATGAVVGTEGREAPMNEKVRIGVILPLSGDLSVTGEKMGRGIRLAAEELPQDRYEVIFEDSRSNAAGAVTAASKLINADRVDVLIGPYSPDETLAVAPLARGHDITVFSLSFCSDSFKEHENVFCSYPGAAKQLDTVMPLLREREIQQMALVDTNSDFGLNSRDTMRRNAPSADYTVVVDELVNAGEKDYRTIIAKIRASDADAVFSATDNPADALLLMKQLHDAGFDGMRITFVDVDNKYLEMYGAAVDGTYAPGIAPSSFSAEYTAKYVAKHEAAPDYPSALGYDVLRAVVGTIEQNNRSARHARNAAAYEYPDPAIDGFRFLPDRTVTYQLELWQAVESKYVKAD